MSQQKESDGGISPGAGALEGRKCGCPQKSEHLFSWPFHCQGWKWYYRCFCTAEWEINKQQSKQVLCRIASDFCVFWARVAQGRAAPGRICVSGSELHRDHPVCAGLLSTLETLTGLSWWCSAGIHILGSGWFPAELGFVQDPSLRSLLGVTLVSLSTRCCLENRWI